MTCEKYVSGPVKDNGADGTIKDRTVISAAANKGINIATGKSSDLFCSTGAPLIWIKRSMLDAALYHKKIKQDTEKLTLRNAKGLALYSTSQVQLVN